MSNIRKEMNFLMGKIDRKEYLFEDGEIFENEEEVRNLELETKILRLFNDIVIGINSMKYNLKPRIYGDDIVNHPDKIIKLQKEKSIVKSKLYAIAVEKMDILKDVIENVLGNGKEEEEGEKEE